VIRKIRVSVQKMPQLVRDVLGHAINSQPDMEVIADPSAVASAAPVPLDPAAPDVVVLGGAGAEEARQAAGILSRWPRSHVLTLALDGHQAALHTLKPHRMELGELSPIEVVDSIRQAVRRRRENDESDPRS
jgi:DNA-binding NarL/FixJ family response regulator